jgi:hypothetical protein
MAPPNSIITRHVIPALGTVVAWAMFIAPLKAVLQVRRSKALGVSRPGAAVAEIRDLPRLVTASDSPQATSQRADPSCALKASRRAVSAPPPPTPRP